jgi:hypothetical protein
VSERRDFRAQRRADRRNQNIADGSVTWKYFRPASWLVPTVIEGLVGAASRTPAGGLADLRSTHGCAGVGGAFDEFNYTADLRKGAQSQGRQNISHLGVFIWWLRGFPIAGATPVSNGATPPCFTFDPTGRQIQLFATSSRITSGAPAGYGEEWVSPDEWTLSAPIVEDMWQNFPDQLYGGSLQVGWGDPPTRLWIDRKELRIHPEKGLFSFLGDPPAARLVSQYNFGFMSTVGAGGFDPLILGSPADGPSVVRSVATDNDLTVALGALVADTTIVISNSQTYAGPADITLPAITLVLRAGGTERPVFRWAGQKAKPAWTINGGGSNLVIQGIWLQGADIVLTGSFDSVTFQLATLDPGSNDPLTGKRETAIDGAPLAPVRLCIKATVRTLTLARCVCGPILTLADASGKIREIETLSASDSIIQALPALLPDADGDLAIETGTGAVSLNRCTILGPISVHELSASECIFDEPATAEDSQHGCVRFCAYADGSTLHAPFQSVVVPPRAPIFVSRHFGDPSYARLARLADSAIIPPANKSAHPGDSIVAGAENGSEMGAFAGEGIALVKRALAIKFEEYAPLGVYPVWIDAD